MVSLFSIDACNLECSDGSLPETHSLFSVDSLNELGRVEQDVGEKSTTMDAVDVLPIPDGKKLKLRKVGRWL